MYSLGSNLNNVGTEASPELHTIFSAYVGIALCVVGLIGNITSVIVWRRINKRRRDSGKSAGMFLIALAFSDSGLLLFFMATESFNSLATSAKTTFSYIWFYCYIGFPLYFFFIVLSIWMVISITYNRFVAVVFPHKTATMNTVGKSKLIITLTVLFSFAINMPHFFNHHPVQDDNQLGKWTSAKTDYGKTFGASMYNFWGHCMLLVLIPWLLISVLNLVIIRSLYVNRPVSMKKRSKEHQTTIILLTVSFAFLFFLIWQCITQCFYMLHFQSGNPEIWYNISSAYAPARLGVIMNSSINFLLYCLSGQMFRKEMYKLFAELCGCNSYLVLLESSSTASKTMSRAASVSPSEIYTKNSPRGRKKSSLCIKSNREMTLEE